MLTKSIDEQMIQFESVVDKPFHLPFVQSFGLVFDMTLEDVHTVFDMTT
jgi:hypothetical protein